MSFITDTLRSTARLYKNRISFITQPYDMRISHISTEILLNPTFLNLGEKSNKPTM